MKTIKNFNLTEYNSYGIKSFCSRAFFPESEDDIIEIYKNSKSNIIVLGNGNNTILSKDYYDEEFIIFNNNFDNISEKDNIIEAESGATLYQLSNFALQNSLTGAEFCFDIPSSVGGAVVMNAGTKEGEIKNILQKVRYLDLINLEIKERNNTEIEFGYRNSFFQENRNKIILKAWFGLGIGDKCKIRANMDKSRKRRWERQPREYPNCGSVFKRPPGRFVGPMIDELGLKGFTIGGAQISQKHSGFIINVGCATGKDILAVINEVKLRVKEKHGIELEVEQRIV
ncbi:UDP-N-acetylmuramate dehydrogenase [Zhouia amylolytica]|uniref:UDP-N-acetylenolpyruvoylglucosamine reductase n=1 Tax=Zhouia amylolytica TaxID=376730 RepID=A0A1I6QRU9_9FLAO|nr:UDP-N-acetylmuramate dehydrogenase [Zhouia amylolytica]SFS55216.1 UDP-N-acetylmuramate dehydrogenase [Zhouia amylolytica]